MDEAQQVYEQVANYFGLLADPTRLRILSCLCADERPVHEVVEKIGLTQANISRHLNILYRAGVVDRRREGSSVLYRVVDPNFVDICRTVSITVASRDLGEQMGVAGQAKR
ncbi:ArsR family transcriptional regulator [Dechloromonas denitrificans]|uniref:ArsR family transcriptional regulator n=1 Tax=Dechloromonas denitrificans TaxID=281362 RepID=A0A133XJS0_9RHOO|nr:metalloregulator ArsR/SmtB family transcription factor [Dechloromonas denitrificans]KXB31195.1 ArsR family transcriptional regulator [Dechloromonas denitrificans]